MCWDGIEINVRYNSSQTQMNIQIQVGKFNVSKEEGIVPRLTFYNMTSPNWFSRAQQIPNLKP